jgi:hypothetical protein
MVHGYQVDLVLVVAIIRFKAIWSSVPNHSARWLLLQQSARHLETSTHIFVSAFRKILLYKLKEILVSSMSTSRVPLEYLLFRHVHHSRYGGI